MSKRIATRILALPLGAFTLLLVVACAANKSAPTAIQPDAIELIAAGRLEEAARRFEQAEQVLEAALTAPAFSDLSAADQVYAYWFASFAAAARKDHVLAHQRMVAATAHAEAGAEHWLVRAQWAAAADEWSDGASAIATVAERWPARLRTDAARELVPHITSSVRRDGANPTLYLKLVEALFDAEFTLDFDIQPDYWWLQLLLDALHRDDLARATAIAARIETTDTVLRMRIDRRFDAVVALDPERFDIDATARRKTAAMAKAMADRPRSLEPFVQYSYALFDEGRHDEVLAMCDGILAAVASASSPLFDDLDESLNWVYNHKAAALRARGQWDEALAVMEVGRKALEKGGVNVSQTINLATHYNDAGRPQQALDTIQGLDCGDAVSPYGCLLLYVVRYRAHLQLHNRAEAQKAFDYVGEHRAVSDETWLQVVLESGDLESAAQLLIDQLEDPDTRGTALVNAQRYLPMPMTPIMQQAHQHKLRVLARADVAAVIEKVGRRGTVPLYRTPN